jgi:hypothetical protein
MKSLIFALKGWSFSWSLEVLNGGPIRNISQFFYIKYRVHDFKPLNYG